MTTHQEQLAHLDHLAKELTGNGLAAVVVGNGSKSYLKVANADTPSLNERVLCYQAHNGSWSFWWPWQQPIGSVDDLNLVVSRIVLVLRSVETDG